MVSKTILVVDDEESILESISGILEDEGYEVITASTGEQAIMRVNEFSPEVVILDVWLPGIDGLETLKIIMSSGKGPTVIMMSGHGTIDLAVQATRLGAYDFLEKPLSLEKLLILVQRAIEQQQLKKENQELKSTISHKTEIVGESTAICSLKDEIKRIGPTQGRVLILGESGTGKELVARAIHEASARHNNAFVEVNCAAIPQELIESELFGHEKGSFTGAFARKKGKFELAHNGTLFLDEIGDMALATQAKVLRIIETQEFQRVGGNSTIKVDVRLIAATNKDLPAEIKKSNFREDLYFRLNVIPIHLPTLRERREDVPLLIQYFLNQFARQYGQKPKKMNGSMMKTLIHYEWPGNVRELKNAIERFIITDSPGISDTRHQPAFDECKEILYDFQTLKEARDHFEKAFITKKLQENHWNISKTAEKLEIERSNLYRKIKSLGIDTQ